MESCAVSGSARFPTPMSESANNAVFLSYALQDAEAVLRIAEALRAAGVEVWFDKNELAGGDAWDAKIRGQISSCALFVPIISAATQARLEGYFRIEWKLAAQRTHAMAEAKPFLLPVVIDQTRDAEAHVPTEFRAVQWTRLPNGEANAAFVAHVKKLLGGERGTGILPVISSHGQEARATTQPVGRRVPAAARMAASFAAITATAVVVWWQPWRSQPSANPPAMPVSPILAPQSETQTLIAKIAAIVEKDADATRDDWALAERMGAQAVGLEPANAAAWTAYADAALGIYLFFSISYR